VWLCIQVEYHSLLPKLARGVPTITQMNRKIHCIGQGTRAKEGKVCACCIPAQQALLVRGAMVDGDDVQCGQKEIHCLVNKANLVHNFS
jgi:hypothetical protein